MVARLADLIGVDHIGIGSDLCQDQPDSVVAWMRNGRWTKGAASIGLGAAVFPPQPAWFRDNRDFGKIRDGPACARASRPDDAAKIMGGNWYRFYADAFTPRASRLTAERVCCARSGRATMSTRSETGRLHGHEGRRLLLEGDDRRARRHQRGGPADPGGDRPHPAQRPRPRLPLRRPRLRRRRHLVEMWRRVLAHQRAREPGRPIEIVYADLPRNDFSQLFRMIHGQTDTASYYGQIPDVYPFASGTSFHQAIFPRESLDLAFSATASHYISKVPVQHRQPRTHGGRRRRGAARLRGGRPHRVGATARTCAPANSSRAGGSCSSISASTRRAAISARPAA